MLDIPSHPLQLINNDTKGDYSADWVHSDNPIGLIYPLVIFLYPLQLNLSHGHPLILFASELEKE